MTVWVELALCPEPGAPETFEALVRALNALPTLAASAVERSRVVRHRRESASRRDWRVTLEALPDGAATLRAAREMAGGTPGVARYRRFARPAGDDIPESLRELVDSEKALADLPPAEFGAPRDIERATWAIATTQPNLRVDLESEEDGPPRVTLAACEGEGALAALFALAREIIDALPLFLDVGEPGEAGEPEASDDTEPVRASKLALPARSTAREAFAAIAASIAVHWFGNDARARRALGVEHVHQLRVAQRRLKTALKLFPGYVDETWQQGVAPDLKWFGDLLAEARDADVFIDTTLAGYAEADGDPAHWQPTIDAAERARGAARAQVAEALTTRRYARLVLAFVRWMSELAERPDEDATPLADYARKRIARHYRKIARAPDLTTLDAPSRHRVRIHAKRLRYALEFFDSITTRATRHTLARRLGKLQTVLGEANDAAVAADRLAAIPAATDYQRGFARAWAVAAERRDAAGAERLLRRLHKPRVKASL